MLESIKFSYKESENQNDLFTTCHRRYACMIKYNGKQYSFDYQCNPNHSLPNVKDCVDSLLLDGFAYDDSKDLFDFADNFGYGITRETEKIYNACKKTSRALHRLFTDDELSVLQDELND